MKTQPMTIHADVIEHFLSTCRDVEEARKAIPTMTRAAFDGVRAGTLRVKGDSVSGIEIVAVNLDDRG